MVGSEQPEGCPIQGDNNKRDSKKMESLVSLSPGGNESLGDNPIIFNLCYEEQTIEKQVEHSDTIPLLSQISESSTSPNQDPEATLQSTESLDSASDDLVISLSGTTHYIVPVTTLTKVVNDNLNKCKVCKQKKDLWKCMVHLGSEPI